MNIRSATRQNNTVGILSAMAASFFFSINDMAIKLLSGDYALHQVVLIRTVIGMTLLLALIVPFQGGFAALKTRRLLIHLLRGFCVVVANMTFFLGLAVLPLAQAVAIFFIAPLVITIFSVLFLGEKVGRLRWLAVGFGLAGVVVILRPGTGSFQIAALLPLAAAIAYATLNILTRKIGGTERAVTMIFYIQVTFIFVSGAMGMAMGDGRFGGQADPSLGFLLRQWVRPETGDWPLFLLIGAASTGGGYFISQAYKLAEAGLAAPFEYVAMPLSIFWGFMVFGEWPDGPAWAGITLIVGAGLFVFWREIVLDRRVASRIPQRLR
ncbi:MAG: DMT family transporter [Paracoccaceae bacterium]